MSTIKDVARAAGVSIATVSCTLSGKKQVSHATRVKIMAAIERLNYIPNESARKLKLRTSRDIGVLMTSIDDMYHSEIFKGITSVIQENNFSVNIGFSNNLPKVEAEILNDFVSRNSAGIIVISCMPGDADFFEKLLSHNIPVVFIERRPPKLDVNFVGISNKKTITFLAEKLKEQGYTSISLFCGNPGISSESDCAEAFRDFCQKNGIPGNSIHYTNMSKEDAFRTALLELHNDDRPEAIIATSENIAHGIMESAGVLGLSLNDSVIIAFSEETWMNTKYLQKPLHTSRPAFKLGASATKLLLQNISSARVTKKETILLDDNIIRTGIDIPPSKPRIVKQASKNVPELKLLLLDSPFTKAVKYLARKFRNDYGISIQIHTEKQNFIPFEIMQDAFSPDPRYDIFMFDIPWLDYLVQNGCLEDLTEFITGDSAFFNSIIKENLINSMYKKRYYSIPFAGGAQLMFYRTDLFEDPLLGKDYFAMNKSKLQPPRTWTEFNTVARFFTRKYNPASPVEFGTSCPGNIAEEFCPEIYNRILGFNGSFFSKDDYPQFNTPNNKKAFENLIELQNYTASPLFQTSLIDTVDDFYNGKTAMLTTFTLYAGKIMSAINQNVFGKIGFTIVPGKTPISVGWNLGINIFSKKKKAALKFFKWLYQKDVNYYLTILDGESTSVYPYENNELLKLYPWMQHTMENFKYAQKRINTHNSNHIIIPVNRIEDIIFNHSKRMFENLDVESCLEYMNNEMTELMTVYGHFRGNT
jgi:multiple sugar transport system substrate-binding protein